MLPRIRDPLSNLQNARGNKSNMLNILHYLYKESFGDKRQSLLLVNWYYQAVLKRRQEISNDLNCKLETHSNQFLIGDKFKNVVEMIEKIFE